MNIANAILTTTTNSSTVPISCDHCGDPCLDQHIEQNDHHFCCNGCQLVYSLLSENDLTHYYQLEQQPGINRSRLKATDFQFLEDVEIQARLLDYMDDERCQLRLELPQIHCSSCVWLLENLYQLLPGILSSRVNFLARTAAIAYDPGQLSLRQLVEMLDRIGYTPALQLNQLEEQQKASSNKSLYYRLGLAGFAFGNIMLLSFPEYFGLTQGRFLQFFGYLNIVLAIPVLLYAAYDYWHAAYLSLRQKHLSIDVPITLGMLALFSRSVYEILTHTGTGYLDSLAGLVFFLLIGKWFQQRTYQQLSFERDYKSYFPLAVTVKDEDGTYSRSLDKLQIGDTIVVKDEELIPADAILLNGQAKIDYSFVTGESKLVPKKAGDFLFAGGRQRGDVIELKLQKTVSQSYLTQLWNDSAFEKSEDEQTKLANQIGKWFTYFILIVAFASLIYWLPIDTGLAINAFSAVLIIACPCAIALSIPFTYGNLLRWFGQVKFYLKNVQVIDHLQRINTIVFDKTGTLTDSRKMKVSYQGQPISDLEQQGIQSLSSASNHPLSRQLSAYLPVAKTIQLEDFQSITGSGLRAIIDGKEYRLGSAAFIKPLVEEKQKGSLVYVEIDRQYRGCFRFSQGLRQGTAAVMKQLQKTYTTYLLSGDHAEGQEAVASLFEHKEHLRFQQQPQDKLTFIKQLQEQGANVMMIGDGLNDAGALQQSDIGIVVTDNINNFSPACDAILSGEHFRHLPSFLTFSIKGKHIVYGAYLLAFCYNVIGLSYAVQAQLSPVIAAILMPLSSVTIVAFGVLLSSYTGRRMTKVISVSDKSQ